MGQQNWDDLRFVLAAAEGGSVSAAARRLKVNHATVIRRIAAFEAQNGAQIFDKTPKGYLVSPDCGRIIEALREVDQSVRAVSRMIEAVRTPLSGEVRVTSTDSICQVLLPSLIKDVIKAAPQLSITLLSSNAHIDMGRIRADITVRPTQKLPDELVGQKVGEMAFALFCKAGPDRPAPPGLAAVERGACGHCSGPMAGAHDRQGADRRCRRQFPDPARTCRRGPRHGDLAGVSGAGRRTTDGSQRAYAAFGGGSLGCKPCRSGECAAYRAHAGSSGLGVCKTCTGSGRSQRVKAVIRKPRGP